MRLITVVFFIGILPVTLASAQGFDPHTCTCKGKLLSGDVRVVSSNPDIRVEVVSYDPDLLVDSTESYPSECGEWRFSGSNPDFTVQFVGSGGDLKVKFSGYAPGVPDSRKSREKPEINPYTCTWKGLPLYGKVKVVENFEDIKVKVVTSFPDLKVQLVEHFPDQCGKWQMVENFPDIKIKFVEAFEDIKIQYVTSFPGIE